MACMTALLTIAPTGPPMAWPMAAPTICMAICLARALSCVSRWPAAGRGEKRRGGGGLERAQPPGSGPGLDAGAAGEALGARKTDVGVARAERARAGPAPARSTQARQRTAPD